MRRTGLMVVVALVAALIGTAGATDWGRDSLGAKYLVYPGFLTGNGPMCFRMMNTDATDTLEAGDVVGFDTTTVTVVTLYAVGNATDTSTLVSITNLTTGDIDSANGPRTFPPTGFPIYDTAKAGLWKMRAVWVTPSAGANDTKYVYIKYRPTTSEPMTLLSWTKIGTGAVDTCFSVYASRICSVFVTGQRADDSFALYAEPVWGVKVNTVLDTIDNASCYAGVVREQILPRRRGLVQFAGPAEVKVDASSADAKNGYWLSPSAAAGYAVATDTAPFIPIGRLVGYEQDNTTQAAMLYPPSLGGWSLSILFANTDTIEAGLDSVQAEVDSVKNDLDAAEAAIDSVQSEVDSVKTEVDSARAAIDSVQSEVDSVKVDLDSASAGLDSVQAEVDSMKYDLPEISWTSFRAGQFVLAADSAPALIQGDSTNFSWDALAFDQTAMEKAYILDWPGGYVVGDTVDSIKIQIAWTANTASADSVQWDIGFLHRNDGELFDSTLGYSGSVSDANTGQGKLNICTVVAAGPATALANDLISFSIARDVTQTANLASDVHLVMVRFGYYKKFLGSGF